VNARPGSVVDVDGRRYQLLDRAAPSGWWAVPAGEGRAVRLVSSRRQVDAAAKWRVA
jgi:hypothetical protein